MKLLAIIPTFNEEKKIKETINALKSLDGIVEVVVADDNSMDNTVSEAESTQIKVIKHQRNLGKGNSINKALSMLELEGYDGLILADGDLGKSALEFKHLIDNFRNGYDLLIAGFGSPSRKGGFGFVKRLAFWSIQKYGNYDMKTPISGQRLLSVKALESILPFASGFGMETDMTIKFLKNGYKVKEVKTSMTHNETGRDLKGFIHRGKQFKDILKVVIKHMFTK